MKETMTNKHLRNRRVACYTILQSVACIILTLLLLLDAGYAQTSQGTQEQQKNSDAAHASMPGSSPKVQNGTEEPTAIISSPDCDCIPSRINVNHLTDKVSITYIQRCLQKKNYYLFDINGEFDIRTVQAIQRCRMGEKKAMGITPENVVSYILTQEDLDTLSALKEIIAECEKLNAKGGGFAAEEDVAAAFDAIVTKAVAAYKINQDSVNSIIEMIKSMNNMVYQEVVCTKPPEGVFQPPNCQINFWLSKRFVTALKNYTLPDDVLVAVRNLENVEYPDLNLFKNALNVVMTIQHVIELCSDDKTEYIKARRAAELLSAAQINCREELQEILAEDTTGKLPAVIAKNTGLSETANLRQVAEKLMKNIQAIPEDQAFQKNLALLTFLAKEDRGACAPEDTSTGIQWEGSAGCYFDSFPDYDIYGMYPYWLAGNPQKIDFSSFTRIGYFAVGFTDEGNFTDSLEWLYDKQHSAFIDKARAYRNKIDLVIYRNDWRTWQNQTQGVKHASLERLAENICNTMKKKRNIGLTNRIMPYLSLGKSQMPDMWDGVIINFSGYDFKNNGNRIIFSDFIKLLHRKLYSTGRNYQVSMVIPMSDLISKHGHKLLHVLTDEHIKLIEESEFNDTGSVKERGKAYAYINRFLVPIEEPSTISKKKIREDIEEEFSGLSRRIILRKIIPLVSSRLWRSSLEENRQQLHDDLVYFMDNFGGAGFWPLPIIEADSNNAQILCNDIKKVFQPDDVKDQLQVKLARYAPTLFNFIGPHRWIFYIIMDLILLVLLVYWALSLWSYELRAFFWRFVWWFAVAIGIDMLLFLALLAGDPFYREHIVKILFGMVAIMAVIFIWGFVRKMQQQDYP